MRISENEISKTIVEKNHERELHTFSEFACLSKNALRQCPELEKVSDFENIRPPFFHDIDKIIHSKAYARYMDKTQVFSLFKNQHITHRSLHVQLVAKIGRTIGRCLRLNEDLIEAIALGHDLGHPPFGHDGENILNNLCKEHSIGSFAHNAQSVRALTKLENHGRGLNMTLQVLDGILAHNGEILEAEYRPHQDKDWKMLEHELEQSFIDEGYGKKIRPMTLEGCVVRISDVIAYIGRDIEDAIHLNLIKRSRIPTDISCVLGDTNSQMINILTTDLIERSYDSDALNFSPRIYEALSKLKSFNYEEIYFNPAIKGESKKIERMFYLLFDLYYKAIEEEDHSSQIYTFYIHNRDISKISEKEKKRMIIDFMASMTDEFIINQFNELFFPKRFGYFVKSD